MANPPQVRGLVLIFVGDFNPTIFQPSWFASEKLITIKEAEDADIQVVHPDVTSFNLGWFSLAVERDKCQFVCTAQPYFERLVGLACQTFELLRHTPIRLLGINNEAHYRASSEDKWHTLGHRLAPKDFWKQFFPKPGLESIIIRQIPRVDKHKGYVQVTVAPSVRVHPGVYVQVNDHYETASPGEIVGASKAVEILKGEWPNTLKFAESVIEKISEQL